MFDLRMIELWAVFLLNNLFINFGDQFRRQAIGAPTASSCSGGIVNLYLCSYELDFVEQLSNIHVSPHHPPELVLLALIQRAFLLTSRFLDDISSINNPYFDRLLYTGQTFLATPIRGIYPPHLTLLLCWQAICTPLVKSCYCRISPHVLKHFSGCEEQHSWPAVTSFGLLDDAAWKNLSSFRLTKNNGNNGVAGLPSAKKRSVFPCKAPNFCLLPSIAAPLRSTLACHCRAYSVSALDGNNRAVWGQSGQCALRNYHRLWHLLPLRPHSQIRITQNGSFTSRNQATQQLSYLHVRWQDLPVKKPSHQTQ